MEVLVLGSGGTAPWRDRACSSFLVDGSILIDVGPGSTLNFRRFYGVTNGISAVVITHMHGDHVFDLPALLWGMAADGRDHDLVIYGPKGIGKALQTLFSEEYLSEFMPKNFVKFRVDVHEIEPGATFNLDKYYFKTAPGIHPVKDISYRIEAGNRVVCFSGDTAYSKDLIALSSDADLLVHESSFFEGEEELAMSFGHSTSAQAGDIAKRAGVKLLLLSHITPRLSGSEERLKVEAEKNGVKTLVARDGMEVLI